MVDYLQVSCPGCQRELRVRRQYIGIQVACKHCGRAFQVQAPAEPPEAVASSATDAATETAWIEMETHKEQIAALTRKLRRAKAELEKTNVELAHTAEQLTLAQAEQAGLQGTTQQLEEAMAERASLQQRVLELEQELANSRDTARLNAELREDLSGAQAQCEQYRAQIASLEPAASNAEQLNQELQAARDENDQLTEQLRKSADERASLETDRDHWKAQSESGAREREQLLRSLVQLESAAPESQAEIDRYRQEAAAAKQRHEEAIVQLDALRNDQNRLAQHCDQLTESLQQSQKRNHEFTESLAQAKRNNELTESFEQAQIRNNELTESFEQAQIRNNELTESFEQAQKRNNELTESLEQAQKRNNELTEEVQHLESKLAESATASEATSAGDDRAELIRQLQRAQLENDELRAAIQSLGIMVTGARAHRPTR